ncbi:MAG: dTMP kinase [Alphaproteobacteria bacterium]
MARGKFITLEGGEGAGKTTQARLLAEGLHAAGLEVVTTREPGGSPGAEHIRELLVNGDVERWDPMTEALLHFAARRDHLVKTVWPALEAGRWVVCDRFTDSTLAYQGIGLGLGRDAVEAIARSAVGAFAPDLTIILDLAVDVGLARAKARSDDHHRYERMDRAFHERLRQGFLDIAGREPARCVVIDGARAIEDVQRDVRGAVRARLKIEIA